MDGLGEALRRWRSDVRPEDVGLPRGGVRRTPGLRREELAQLAGISVDYVSRLEQGRADAPSTQVLAALARALRLCDPDRARLYALAGRTMPSSGYVPTHVTPSVQRLVDQLVGTPVGVFDAGWTLRLWNPLWAALLGDPAGRSDRDRNVLWRHFVLEDIRAEQTAVHRDDFEAYKVTQLRETALRYPRDTEVASLVEDLLAASPAFRRHWETRDREPTRLTSKRILHPEVGPVDLDCDELTSAGGDLRIVAYTAAPGSVAAERIRLLDVIGTQQLA